MSVIGKYPGVFPEITDLSQITENASTSIIGAVGEARRGSVFKRKYITSTAAYQTTFGEPDLKYGYLGHCMTCAMTDAGEAYVVRVCSDDSRHAGLKVPVEGKPFPKFVDGYSLTEVRQAVDEDNDTGAAQTFFYKYQVDADGHYVWDVDPEDPSKRTRKQILDDDGNPVIEDDVALAFVGENPNEEDIRVQMQETTIVPANKPSVSVSLTDEESLTANNLTAHKYVATVNTGTTEHGMVVGDKVIISKSPMAAFNGTFEVSGVSVQGSTCYAVRKNNSYSDEDVTKYYVSKAAGKKVSEVLRIDGEATRYAEEPTVNFDYKFAKLSTASTKEEIGEPVYVHADRLEDQTITTVSNGWFIPVISRDSEVPGIFFVKVENSRSTLEDAVGNPIFRTPVDTTPIEQTYTASEWEDLGQVGARRFMVSGVSYGSDAEFKFDEDTQQWIPTTGTWAGTSNYVDEESTFFVYMGKYKFLEAGLKVYNDPELRELATDEGFVENGRALSGKYSCSVDADYNLLFKQFVPASTKVYLDPLLLHPYEVTGLGGYIYTQDTSSITNETNAFSYVLNEKPTDTSEETIAGLKLRWVKAPSNNERKFDVFVFRVEDGEYTLLESFNDCTMYSNVDGYGVQTQVTSKINGKSEIISVVVNEDLLVDGNCSFPRMTSTSTGKLTGGSTEEAIDLTAVSNGWELFRERDKVTVNLLMECAYSSENISVVKQKMLEIANFRRDCFCVFDTPIDCVKSGVNQVVENYRKNTLGIDSYRAALYAPWVKVYDSFTGTNEVPIPPSGFACGVIARTDTNRGVWIAPAGMNNGPIMCAALTPVGLTYEYATEEQGSVYSSGINYIRKTNGMYLIWGQKTLQFKPSALDRINVTRMVIYIETSLREAAKWHLFEQNTAYRRAMITMQFEAWLAPIKAAGGLYDFKVVCDETNNTPEVRMNNQMYIDIYIQPEYAVEFIKLNTIVQRADATIGIVA